MKWIHEDKAGQSTYTLVDSLEQDVAEVFKVDEDEWHMNVLDVFYGVHTAKEDAMRAVFDFLGIRPER